MGTLRDTGVVMVVMHRHTVATYCIFSCLASSGHPADEIPQPPLQQKDSTQSPLNPQNSKPGV